MSNLRLVDEDGDVLCDIDSIAAASIAYHLTMKPCDSRDCVGLAEVLRKFARRDVDGQSG